MKTGDVLMRASEWGTLFWRIDSVIEGMLGQETLVRLHPLTQRAGKDEAGEDQLSCIVPASLLILSGSAVPPLQVLTPQPAAPDPAPSKPEPGHPRFSRRRD